MESIVRNVRDINSSERLVLEHVLGQQLAENQQVIIQVVTMGKEPAQDEQLPPAMDYDASEPDPRAFYPAFAAAVKDDLDAPGMERYDEDAIPRKHT